MELLISLLDYMYSEFLFPMLFNCITSVGNNTHLQNSMLEFVKGWQIVAVEL